MCAARGVAATVGEAVAGGVTAVQVRDPLAGDRELYELVTSLHEHLDGTRVPLIVNNRADVALAASAEGVHVGQSDLPAPAVRAMVGAGLIVGLSITAVGQLAELESWPVGTVDYLGVGPVFASATKADAAPPMGLTGLAAIVAATSLPCVAIGGVSAANATEVMATGVAGVAVVSAVCASPDPARAAADLRRAIRL